MYPHELIGKKAIRKAPTVLGQDRSGLFSISTEVTTRYDYSYNTEPIIILAVTESHIIFQYPEGHYFKGDKKILDSRWVDDNWTDYDKLMELTSEEHVKMMQELNQDKDVNIE